ncbi:hypothetical protein ASF72_18915 [Arthrobacter sp. Leaf141]|uniref:hypothetical protein n=1 Tax=Arthrobacter sp. Leaf141 TaxID=1736273 RepID=UPI0006FB9228|nr:hypothetical protein [Arthrobacter sp. Leaf141]KQQ96341.1 hypothetical protein ASF72_18915 [Arthrobacter sp. Leaf141]
MTKLLNVVDDRKTSWVYLVPVGVILLVFFGVLQGPNGDSKLQAALLLGLAALAMGICWMWASTLSKAELSLVDYIKGTTTSRTMLWYWMVFGAASLVADVLDVGTQMFASLWESSLLTFGGVGSILLTAVPAYKEFREAQAAAMATRSEG